MLFALICGIIAGIGLIIYRGIYFGPWSSVLNTMGTAILAAIVVYIFLQILASIGGFFLRLIFVIIFVTAVLFGGEKLWNIFNPDDPISLTHYITQPFNGGTSNNR